MFPSLRGLLVVVLMLVGCGSRPEAAARSPALAARACPDVSACERVCEGGDGASCHAAGTLYEVGEGVAQDHERAATLYRLGCSHGSSRACNNLGVLHEIGLGVPQDDGRARELYERACGGGETPACNNKQRLGRFR